MAKINKISKGDRVRDTKWNGKFTGTVVRTATRKGCPVVFVQWNNLAVEDELLATEVKALETRIEGNIPNVVKMIRTGKEL